MYVCVSVCECGGGGGQTREGEWDKYCILNRQTNTRGSSLATTVYVCTAAHLSQLLHEGSVLQPEVFFLRLHKTYTR